MPELPEVETTRRGLEPHLLGRRIEAAVVREPRLRWPVPEDLSETLAGRAIRGLTRRGKYLLLECEGGHLLLHLGMSGSLRVLPQGAAPEKHDHVDLLLDNGKLVRLTDPRRFGAVLWLADAPERHPLLQGLGVEPLSPEFTPQWLYQATRGATTAVKLWLMDGRRVCGIGNIYANEALFDAGIHPGTRAGRIGAIRCKRLVAAVRETLERAIAAGGSTLRDFVGSDGRPGYFQQQYWVYGRAGEPCRRCGATIRSLRQGQRVTYYCPACQR